jgi:hypothetical protein
MSNVKAVTVHLLATISNSEMKWEQRKGSAGGIFNYIPSLRLLRTNMKAATIQIPLYNLVHFYMNCILTITVVTII